MPSDSGANLEGISSCRCRNIWCSAGAFDPAVLSRTVESLSEYADMTFVSCGMPPPRPTPCQNKGYANEN